MELMTKKAPNLILKHSCSATAKVLHCDATRISWALILSFFRQIFSWFRSWMTNHMCKQFWICVSSEIIMQTGVFMTWRRSWLSEVRARHIMTGRGVSRDWWERGSPHMYYEAGGEVERRQLLKIQNLQLQR